jgi:hypothetical protein
MVVAFHVSGSIYEKLEMTSNHLPASLSRDEGGLSKNIPAHALGSKACKRASNPFQSFPGGQKNRALPLM